MGAAPPWGQSLLRSYLAARSARRAALRGRPHSFPPPPPVTCFPRPMRCSLRKVHARNGSTRCAIHVSESTKYKAGEAPSCGGWGREGVRSTPKRGSPRGAGSEVRAEQRLAPGGPQAPITRKKHRRAMLVRSVRRPGQKSWLRRLLLLLGRAKRTHLVP